MWTSVLSYCFFFNERKVRTEIVYPGLRLVSKPVRLLTKVVGSQLITDRQGAKYRQYAPFLRRLFLLKEQQPVMEP